MNKKIIVGVLIFVLLVVVGIVLIKKRKEKIAHLEKPEVPIYTVNGATVKSGEIEIKRDFIGYFQPVNLVKISSKYAGYIKKIYVEEGDTVKKGDVLLLIDDEPIRKQMENVNINISNLYIQLESLKIKKQSLKTNLETNKNIYERNKRLYEKKAISKEQLEKSQTAYEMAKAQYKEVSSSIDTIKNKINELKNNLEVLRNNLNYTKIVSPVNAKVDRIYLREGNLATAGRPILTLEDTSSYQILVEVPTDFKITNVMKGVININGEKKSLDIAEVLPSGSKRNLKIVKFILNEKPKNFVSNSYINISLVKKLNGKIVPINAILHLSNGTFVVINRKGKFEKLPVKLIGENEKFALIEGDIKDGDTVAVGEEGKLRLLSLGKKGKIVLNQNSNSEKGLANE